MSEPEDRTRHSIDAPSIAGSSHFTVGQTPVSPKHVVPSDRTSLEAYHSASQAEAGAYIPEAQGERSQPHRTGSIRSFITRHATRRSHGSHGSGRTREHGEEDTESLNEKRESSLETIVENDSDSDYLTDVKQAAADVADPFKDASPAPGDRRKGYRENLARHRKIKRLAKYSKVIGLLRRLYTDILSKTLITRAFLSWIWLALILFIPLAVDAWGSKDLYLGYVRVMWIFIWLEVGWGSLWVGRILAHYMPEVLAVVLAVVAPQYFFMVDACVALEHPLTYVIWTLVSMVTFIPITSQNHQMANKAHSLQNWQKIINNILVAFLVSALVYFAEQVFIHCLSVSYHRTRMADRIKQNKRAIAILIMLLEAAFRYFPLGCHEFAEEDDVLTSVMKAHSQGAQSKMKKFRSKFAAKFQRALDTTATQIGSLSRDTDPVKIVKNALLTKSGRHTLANRIWKSLVMEDADALSYKDVLEALGNDRHEDALYVFDVLDLDGQGDISLEEMESSVRIIGKEQKNIYRSLQDVDGVITKLHHILLFLLLIIVIVIFVGMLAPEVGAVLATLGSSLLALSFIFASTCQEILASCVFIFVKHPCDVGDIVYIDYGDGPTRMRVLELSLLYTVFADDVTQATRQASNATLNPLFIDNITRSPPQGVLLSLILGIPDTTFDGIEELRRRLCKFLEDNPRDYMPVPWFQVTDLPNLDRVNVTIIPTIRNNNVDTVLFGSRKTRFYEFVAQCIHDIPLYTPIRDETLNSDPGLPLFFDNLADPQPRNLGKRRTYGMLDPVPSPARGEREKTNGRTTSFSSHITHTHSRGVRPGAKSFRDQPTGSG